MKGYLQTLWIRLTRKTLSTIIFVWFCNRSFMKKFFLCIVLLLKWYSQYAQTNALSLQLEQLNHAIKEVPQLDKEKLAQINRLKISFTKTPQTELSKQFELCGALYNAYKLFQ